MFFLGKYFKTIEVPYYL